MNSNRRTVSFVSLGCPKNLVDSENLVSTLMSRGFRVLHDPAEAEMVVVNTCGFLESSRAESVATIRNAIALKSQGVKAVVVAGCMVGNYKDVLLREAPGIDRLVPFADYEHIDQVAQELLPMSSGPTFLEERRRMDVGLTPAHFAYLKISEGCNHTCSFCVIPSIRGPMHSAPIEDLVTRARGLAERGVKELVLIAQDSTVYGTDLYGKNKLVPLLERLDEIAGLRWIRLMYAYPTEVTPALMRCLGSGKRILPYLDVPIQHASDSVLHRMRRGYKRRDLEAMVTGLRGAASEMSLRTTVIVGFPGETEADFEALLEFMRWARFDRLGAFQYSREPGSSAAELENPVPAEVKNERWHRLMALQQELAFLANRQRVGRIEEVLVEHQGDSKQAPSGRTRRDAPEIDTVVRIPGARVAQGEFVQARILAADGYDLVAEMVAREDSPIEV